jgi:hypothetical protein
VVLSDPALLLLLPPQPVAKAPTSTRAPALTTILEEVIGQPFSY